MWTETSKYCDPVNHRRDVRAAPLSHPISLIKPLTQVVIAIEFDLDNELQTGTASRSVFSQCLTYVQYANC